MVCLDWVVWVAWAAWVVWVAWVVCQALLPLNPRLDPNGDESNYCSDASCANECNRVPLLIQTRLWFIRHAKRF